MGTAPPTGFLTTRARLWLRAPGEYGVGETLETDRSWAAAPELSTLGKASTLHGG